MSMTRGYSWGPSALPQFVSEELEAHGFGAGDAVRCAGLINDRSADAEAAGLFVDLGGCKFLEGDIDGAVAAWRHAISSTDDEAAARALLHIGLLYEHVQLAERAIGVLTSVADRGIVEYAMPAAMATARCQRSVGAYEAAMETMAHLVQLVMAERPGSPFLADAFYALGEVAFDASQHDRAERAWRVAAAGDPSAAQAAAANRLVDLLLDHGADDDLVELFERHADLGSHVPRMLDRVDAESRRGNQSVARALASSLRGHDLTPADRFRLVDLRLDLDSANEAIDELEFLLASTDPEVQLRATFLLGEVYRLHEMAEASTAMFERVLDTADRYWAPQAALGLGDLVHAQGDLVTATSYWNRAAESDHRAARVAAEDRLMNAAPDVVLVDESTSSSDDAGTLHGAAPVVDDISATVDPQIVVLSSIEPHEAALVGDHSAGPPTEAMVVRLDDGDAVPRSDESAFAGDRGAGPPTEAMVVRLDDGDVVPRSNEAERPYPGNGADISGDAVGDRAAEPVVVVLSAVEEPEPLVQVSAGSRTNNTEIDETEGPAGVVEQEQQRATSSFFSSQLGDVPERNPYAALAPDSLDDDVAPSARNPYAELAPNFADDAFQPASDVEPGDWESMLDGWPRHGETEEAKPKPKRSSAFSRYA